MSTNIVKEKYIRGYHRSSKAWYALPNISIKVLFGSYHTDGSAYGEMSMEWFNLDNDLCARLQCFEDSWDILNTFSDVISRLAEVSGDKIQEHEFCKILDECGFKDLTEYERK